MKEYLSLSPDKRRGITEKIKTILFGEKEIVFAFIFGSFLDAPSFRDIDIGIYLDNMKEDEIFDYELKISKNIADECSLPFDIFEVKILNFASISFLNNIFSRGQLIFSKNHQLLSDMIENTSLDTIANEYVASQSLKELVPDSIQEKI